MSRNLRPLRLAAAACLALATAPAAALAQKAVFIVRHAEKAADGSDKDIPLSDAGEARAKKLADLLASAGVTRIYSTDTVRTRATGEPLSAASKVPIRIYADNSALMAELRKEPDAVVLVVGHSNTVPGLIAALGVKQRVEIGDKDYGNLFVVVSGQSGEPTLLRLKY